MLLQQNFPNGLPCVSDASMTQFMEAVYEQQPMPTNTTGVPVTLYVLDSNNNYRSIGTTTTNAKRFLQLHLETRHSKATIPSLQSSQVHNHTMDHPHNIAFYVSASSSQRTAPTLNTDNMASQLKTPSNTESSRSPS